MTRKTTSYRLPTITLEQIETLALLAGSSDANVITMAVDRMYQQQVQQAIDNANNLPVAGAKQ